MKRASLVRLLLLVLLVSASVACLVLLPVKDYLNQFFEWVRELGFWGPVLLAAVYVPACVFFVPGSLLTLAAGSLFGVVQGTIAVSAGSVVGAAAAFLIGRFLVRDWIEAKVAANPRFRAIDQAVAENGFKIVLLTRLSPVFPFTLLNYAYGLTRVRFRDYVLASWIGMLPGTIMYVYLGSLVKEVADLAAGKVEGGIGQKVLFGVGLVATVVVTVYVTRIARQALDRAITDKKDEVQATAEPGTNS
jgi:uncharacterized membrane protein YdjX (TVP38/TMEM64 family)